MQSGMAGQDPKRLYLDSCTLGRPFDDQSRMRIRLETNAYYLILQALQNRRYTMVVSPVHFEEANAIRNEEEKQEIVSVLERLGIMVNCDATVVRTRAEYLYARSYGLADAAHVAFSEAAADVFISCDDRFVKKCRRGMVAVTTMTPIEFVIAEDLN